MDLKAVYENLEEFEAAVDEGFRGLYSERDGKYELTGIAGVKTATDVDTLNTTLKRVREERKQVKLKLAKFGKLDAEQVQSNLDEIEDLRAKLEIAEAAAGDGKVDDAQIQKRVDAQTAGQLRPVERERERLQKETEEQKAVIALHEQNNTNRMITDSVRTAAGEAKIVVSAMEDVLMLSERVFEVTEDGSVLTKDGIGATPGIDPAVWLTEMQSMRPHWWPTSVGGGASGGNGTGVGMIDNCFKPGPHFNMTKQAELYKSDPVKYASMKRSAGV